MNPSTGNHRSAYLEAVSAADDDVRDALTHVRIREDAGEITALEAARERVTLLENHLERCRRAHITLLGGQP